MKSAIDVLGTACPPGEEVLLCKSRIRRLNAQESLTVIGLDKTP